MTDAPKHEREFAIVYEQAVRRHAQQVQFAQARLAYERAQVGGTQFMNQDTPNDPPKPDRMLQWFAYAHLTPTLQSISRPFGEMAEWIVAELPANAERTVALRKLLEAKDAAVRAKRSTGNAGWPGPWGAWHRWRARRLARSLKSQLL